MGLDTPTWLQAGTYSARLDRIFADALLTEGVMRPGVGQLLVTQRGAGANESVDIAAGYAVITGDDSADQGNYVIRNTATVNLAAAAAPVANSRIDLVCLRVNDPAAGGPAGDNAQFVYVTGVAAASPAVPATPTSAIALAQVLRTVGDTSVVNANITDVRPASLTLLSNTLTNAGDLLSFDGSNSIRVGLGTTGFPLVAGATSVGYAQLGTTGIADLAVATAKLANGAVTNVKLAANAVNTTNILDNAVTTAKIPDSAITSAKILDGTIALGDLAAAVQSLLVPAGALMPYVGAAAPTGWLLHNQTVAGANTLYPALWAVAPASWKSGTSLVIPNLSDVVLAQTGGSAAALGALGGAMTVTLVEANLPPHAHTIAHTHSIDHDHGAFTSAAGSPHSHTVTDTGHTHTIAARENPVSGSAGSLGLSNAGGTITTRTSNGAVTGISIDNESAHTHSIDVPNFIGTSGAASSGSSGNGAGTSTAVTVRPRHLGVNVILKAH
jgi:microcystin-dependent protein